MASAQDLATPMLFHTTDSETHQYLITENRIRQYRPKSAQGVCQYRSLRDWVARYQRAWAKVLPNDGGEFELIPSNSSASELERMHPAATRRILRGSQ